MGSIQKLVEADIASAGWRRTVALRVCRFVVPATAPGDRCNPDGFVQPASTANAVLRGDGRARFTDGMYMDLLAGSQRWASLLSQDPGAQSGQDSKAHSGTPDGLCFSSGDCAVSGAV